VSFHKAQKHLTLLHEIQSLTELTVIYATAGKRRMPTHQPHGVILSCQNQSQMVERMVLKYVMMKGQNPDH
jgi:light-regulated signal transduction histidine kinase (bacteriophytochrome)